MSTSIQKQKLTQTWDTKKLQEAATRMVAHQITTRLQFMEKHPGKEIEDLEKASAQSKAEMMKQHGVKTPMDLVKHLAEFEVNMFAAEASIEGTDQNAVLLNEKPTVWLEAKKMPKCRRSRKAKCTTITVDGWKILLRL